MNCCGNKVELKVKMDMDPCRIALKKDRHSMIQPMVKVGNEWKLGGSTRGYEADWEKRRPDSDPHAVIALSRSPRTISETIPKH